MFGFLDSIADQSLLVRLCIATLVPGHRHRLPHAGVTEVAMNPLTTAGGEARSGEVPDEVTHLAKHTANYSLGCVSYPAPMPHIAPWFPAAKLGVFVHFGVFRTMFSEHEAEGAESPIPV